MLKDHKVWRNSMKNTHQKLANLSKNRTGYCLFVIDENKAVNRDFSVALNLAITSSGGKRLPTSELCF